MKMKAAGLQFYPKINFPQVFFKIFVNSLGQKNS